MANLKSHLGSLQIGGGRDTIMDEYDVQEEKPEVTIITPDDSADEPEAEVLADDCRSSIQAACTVSSLLITRGQLKPCAHESFLNCQILKWKVKPYTPGLLKIIEV